MQETPQANRLHIGVFGRRNVGKSSLINALTNQELALVSEIAGTTTDPVYKAMELLPVGPVVLVDTAGIDDSGSLGQLRVKKTIEVIRKIDLAILVIEPASGLGRFEQELFARLQQNKTRVVVVVNKVDLSVGKDLPGEIETEFRIKPVLVSALEKSGIEELREELARTAPRDDQNVTIIGDLISPGDLVVLVTPIDSAAPKGRLILPQVQTLRDVIDHDGIAVVCKETELTATLNGLKDKPRIVVTDSQAFHQVAREVPPAILLTGFSILFARYKGDLRMLIEGVDRLASLQAGDKVLIAEACTHRRQADDIGTVKLPAWLKKRVGRLDFTHVAGREYPADLASYDLVLHCGGCMVNRKEMLSRLKEAKAGGVPVVNYGMAIAYLHGILERALQPFPEYYQQWITARKRGEKIG